jgi:aspartate/methionine/tyrosine aminotransferase
MEIMERAHELERVGADIVHLEVGEPDFDVPSCVLEAVARASRDGCTHYTHSLGLWELRVAIAEYYARRYAVQVAPERVIVTTGTSGGLALLMALLLNPGDEVLLPNPGYACYPNFVRAFHGSPTRFDVDPGDGYRYDPDRIQAAMSPRARALLVNSPANPTSAIQTRETLQSLSRLPTAIISDEIYHGLEYEAPAASMLEVTDDCFVLDGFSKRYAMTGWRLGWLVAPEPFVPALQRLQQNLFICPPSVAQHAALAAIRDADADVVRMRDAYRRRRDLLNAGLLRLGFGIAAPPQGAYYILADARHLDESSVRLAHRILEEAHVGVTPGLDFGGNAEGHLRFSFASAYDRIQEGLARLERWLSEQPSSRA